MKCPVCPATDRVMSERPGNEIDYCPHCRGIWLDRGELDKIIERSMAAEGSGKGTSGNSGLSTRQQPLGKIRASRQPSSALRSWPALPRQETAFDSVGQLIDTDAPAAPAFSVLQTCQESRSRVHPGWFSWSSASAADWIGLRE